VRITQVDRPVLERDGSAVRLLVLRTDTAQVGVGELGGGSLGLEARNSENVLVELLRGRDPYNTEALLSDLRDRPPANSLDGFIAAAQTAMSDLVGQALGVPIHQLMGGRVRDQLRACAVGWAGEALDHMALANAARRVAQAGFTALRLDPFGGLPGALPDRRTSVIDAIQTVRDAVPETVDIVVDLAGALSLDDAAGLADIVASAQPLWIEDPFDWDGPLRLASLAERVSIPIAGGRRLVGDALMRLAAEGVVDHIVIDIGRCGGIAEARRVAAIAEMSHVDVIPVARGGVVAMAMAMQLAAAIPNLAMVEILPGSVEVDDGMVAVDLGPGLGFRPMGVLDGEVAW